MDIAYRAIDLEIVHTRGIVREAIETEDETTLLFQKWTIDVDTVYNPEAMSFDPEDAGAVVGSFAVGRTGMFPPETDAAIRQTLLQPQGILKLRDEDGRLILQSPMPGYTVDAKYGPIPKICEVTRIHGTKTWNVHFKIVTYVNECANLPGVYQKGQGTVPAGKNPLLAHRWKRYVDTDEDHFATVVTEGTAIFRADELVKLGTFPDQYRQQLFHAIPANFRRTAIHVQPSEDGCQVNYRVVDEEMAFNGPNVPGGTRIECFQTGGFSEVNEFGVKAGFGAQAATNVVGAAVPGQTAEHLGSGLSMAGRVLQACLPSYSMHVICKVYGNRSSNRLSLMNTAIGVCQSRLSALTLNVRGRSRETIVTQEVTGKFVEVQQTVRWGPEQLAILLANLALAGLPQNPNGINAVLNFFPANEEVSILPPPPAGTLPGAPVPPGTVPILTISQIGNITNPPPNANGTRGTWIGQLVAQALSEPCKIPPRPPIKSPPIISGGLHPTGIDALTNDLDLYPPPAVP